MIFRLKAKTFRRLGEHMNKFDEYYEIRLAKLTDIDDIMSFIRQQWSENHILGTNKSFFVYEHVIDNQVTFLIAKSKIDGLIYSILGYIPASHNKEHLDIWTGIWKTREEAIPFLGIELMKRIQLMLGARTLAGVGDNPDTTVRLNRFFLNSYTAKMKQYYMLSESKEYQIADIKDRIFQKRCFANKTNVVLIENQKQLISLYNFKKDVFNVPYKDEWYVTRRYFNHPINKYKVYGLSRDDGVEALLVLRIQQYGRSKALRVIDCIGKRELLSGLREFFDTQLKEYEYIDFYVLGFEEEYLKKAGFVLRDDKDNNIIPNYFYPFERRNIDIWVDSTNPNMLFVKGDGDQDRPNQITE